MTKYRRVLVCLLAVAALALAGCGGKDARTPSGMWDSPLHHFNNGIELLDDGDITGATVQFELALQIDDEYPPALAGMGYLAALSGDEDAAEDSIDDAYDEVDDDMPVAVQLWPYILDIRSRAALYAAGRMDRDDFIEGVDDVFADASEIAPENAALYYWTGEAYVDALELRAAEVMFHRVLEMKHGYEERARARWEVVQAANRAAPGTVVGKRIALLRTITRADLAALLVEELRVKRFYSRTQSVMDKSFQTPDQSRAAVALDVEAAVRDIDGHPLRADIEKVLHYGVKGLDLYPDRTFRPQAAVTRAEAAMVFEDIVVRATGDKALATRYIGQESHFPDVRGDHSAFNAIMLCTTRGVMQADIRTGAFRPLGRLSGVEALGAVQRLRHELRLFE